MSILPTEFTLHGPTSRQPLLIERTENKQFRGHWTNVVEFVSGDTNVVRIEEHVALPVKNGRATISARVGNEWLKSEVTVQGMEQPVEWSFRNNVQPILAKFGCSSGACHGAAAGQNGFRLSLRGYNDEGDYLALTRHAAGRRIIPTDPARSLLLLKPTGALPHKGGKRFETHSLEYRILSDWIASGAPGPKANEARIERIEIMPDLTVLEPGRAQQLMVRARFSDGHTEDVTRWAKYTSANETVAQVDEQGQVTISGFGEAAISAWYLSRIAIATVSAPYTNDVPADVFTKAPRRNFIDDLVLEKLQQLNLPPSPRCTDAEFIRRAYLDTIGVLPTSEETRAFLQDESLTKRDALIEALLRRPEFVDYWTHKWSDLLLVQSRKLRPPAMWAFYHWIREQVAENTPWDEMVRRLILARGSTLQNGAGNFFVLHEEPREAAETTSQAFLGMSINCAKCHNHPMEKWTNDEYYGFANLFARVRLKAGGRDGETVVFVSDEGDLVQPLTGKPQAPRPLEGKSLALEDPDDRRRALAEWLTSPENRYFSRAIVNRIWANFYGVGLVEAVDDLRLTNPASNEKLLAAAAKFLAQNKFDLKALMRAILQSETYQRSGTALPANADDTRFYSRYYSRRLMAEVLLDAVSQVTGVPTKFQTETTYGGGPPMAFPAGWRALQLPDSRIDSYFLKTFGRPEREKTCECERTDDPNVAQVLHLANGDTIHQKLTAKDNRISKLLAAKTPLKELIEEAYLTALSRYPTETELQQFGKVFAETPESERRALTEDLFWALLSSKEFLFNH
ncbi:MAG: DUF1549 domain-containing protein [Verrucomicrobiota bacterium]